MSTSRTVLLGQRPARSLSRLAQLLRQIFGAEMGVALEVLEVLVACDGCDLKDVQALLEQSACRFVS